MRGAGGAGLGCSLWSRAVTGRGQGNAGSARCGTAGEQRHRRRHRHNRSRPSGFRTRNSDGPAVPRWAEKRNRGTTPGPGSGRTGQLQRWYPRSWWQPLRAGCSCEGFPGLRSLCVGYVTASPRSCQHFATIVIRCDNFTRCGHSTTLLCLTHGTLPGAVCSGTPSSRISPVTSMTRCAGARVNTHTCPSVPTRAGASVWRTSPLLQASGSSVSSRLRRCGRSAHRPDRRHRRAPPHRFRRHAGAARAGS